MTDIQLEKNELELDAFGCIYMQNLMLVLHATNVKSLAWLFLNKADAISEQRRANPIVV